MTEIEVADIDEIYALGKCIHSEKSDNDEFGIYEIWLYENIEYTIGRKYSEGISIMLDAKRV